MNKKDDLILMSIEDCDCCQSESDEEQTSYDCSRRATVFTEREQKVLGEIREISFQVRELKRQIEQLSEGRPGQARERIKALNEFERLRQMRAELEKERIAAAEERMRLLGYA